MESIPMNEQDESSLLHPFSFVSDRVLQQSVRTDAGGSIHSDTMNSELEKDENSKWVDDSSNIHVTHDMMIMNSQVRDADVLLGRGKSNQKHPGNKMFRGKELGQKKKIDTIPGFSLHCELRERFCCFIIIFSNCGILQQTIRFGRRTREETYHCRSHCKDP